MNGPAPAVGPNRYEHTAAPSDGTVTAQGVDATFETAPLVPYRLRRMIHGEFDVAELGD